MNTIDSTDKDICQLLAKDATQKPDVLAKHLKLSVATVRRRIKNLIKHDILRIVGIVNPVSFGVPVSAVVAFDIENDKVPAAL